MRKKIVGITVGVVLVLAGTKKANAANGWEIPLNTTTTTTSQVTSSVSLSLNPGTIQTDLDAANASANPDEAGKVLSQTATITVGNTDGYTVYVSGNANLTGRNSSSHKIPSIASSKTLGSMSNEWGYYGVLGDAEASYNPSTSFKAMTTSQQSVGTGGATSSSVTKKLTLFYGARVTSSAAEDFYGNTVTLSVVAQPRTVTTAVTKFNGITTMQEMTSTICKNATENDTARLRDTRDGKYYWVTKLLDGNCWMSQNLALDLSTSTALTSATSNMDSSWTPKRNTVNISASNPLSSSNTSTANTETFSWNMGNYVITNPTATTTVCNGNNTGLSACPGQFVNVDNKIPSTDPNFYQKNGATYTATEYDAHYLAGNYYQWNAATAGTGGTITNANASGSICPKNWRLPSSNSIIKNSPAYLLQKYGLASDAYSGTLTGTSSVDQNTYNIALSPLFFVRSGELYPSNALKFLNVGLYGLYWSSLANYSSVDYAYGLYFNGSGSSPSNNDFRHLGFSLRCLVPTS